MTTSGSVKITHLIQELSLGGAARAMGFAAKYSSRLDPRFQHSVCSILPPTQEAIQNAADHGMRYIPTPNFDTLAQVVHRSDLVQLQWWNTPHMDAVLRQELPECRLMAWVHVGGHETPHVITSQFITFLDFLVACSPLTYESPTIQNLPPAKRLESTGMAYGAADFERLKNSPRKDHSGFHVGYIGTIHPIKMHSSYVRMSDATQIPAAKFIVYGGGGGEQQLQMEFQQTKDPSRFEYRGYATDVGLALSELDVFGYPLCKETYAASEMVIQEAMYMGVVPVVFPYGGIKRLVIDNFTGLVVRSEEEYTQALEFLYHHPAERIRLSENAKTYARQIFGAEKAAEALNNYYLRLLEKPKQRHRWPESDPAFRNSAVTAPALRFMESIGESAARPFLCSLISQDENEIFEADQSIQQSSFLLRSSGIEAYRNYYQNDPALWFWLGLAYGSNAAEALPCYVKALELGFPHWRVFGIWQSVEFQLVEKILHASF